MMRIQMLPAGCGDCLWIEYGPREASRIIVIDGGIDGKSLIAKLESLHAQTQQDVVLELLVVTHVDDDHIVGILALLASARPWLKIRDLWFNGRPQMEALPGRSQDVLGVPAGDALSKMLDARGFAWNQHDYWRGGPVTITADGPLPVVALPGGLTLTVLGPSLERLKNLAKVWLQASTGKEGRRPDDLLGRSDTWPPVWTTGEQRDPSKTNGSSIALLAEFEGHSLLLGADAFAEDLLLAVHRLRAERNLPGPLPLSAFKLSHHGSARNLTHELLQALDCARFLISTDGTVHRHPDHQALLRLIKYATREPVLIFNTDTETTRPWRERKDDIRKLGLRSYETRFPMNPADGVILELA